MNNQNFLIMQNFLKLEIFYKKVEESVNSIFDTLNKLEKEDPEFIKDQMKKLSELQINLNNWFRTKQQELKNYPESMQVKYFSWM